MARSVVIHGVTYQDVPRVDMPLAGGGGDAPFYDISGCDAAPADVRLGKGFGNASGLANGTMPEFDDGADTAVISTKNGSVIIALGWHSGEGSVGLDPAEAAKIIADNIKAGVTLLGQAGKATVVDTEISSGAAGAPQILNGYKAYVNGQLVNGSYSGVVVSQDPVTKVLSIS